MPLSSGEGGRRSDCKRLAPCIRHSLYFCRKYCGWWMFPKLCDSLSERALAIRKRKQASPGGGGGNEL